MPLILESPQRGGWAVTNKDPITGLYSGLVADSKAKLRQSKANRKIEIINTISSQSYYTILEQLQEKSSPEQIAG